MHYFRALIVLAGFTIACLATAVPGMGVEHDSEPTDAMRKRQSGENWDTFPVGNLVIGPRYTWSQQEEVMTSHENPGPDADVAALASIRFDYQLNVIAQEGIRYMRQYIANSPVAQDYSLPAYNVPELAGTGPNGRGFSASLHFRINRDIVDSQRRHTQVIFNMAQFFNASIRALRRMRTEGRDTGGWFWVQVTFDGDIIDGASIDWVFTAN